LDAGNRLSTHVKACSITGAPAGASFISAILTSVGYC
jgi:hypothetical protein